MAKRRTSLIILAAIIGASILVCCTKNEESTITLLGEETYRTPILSQTNMKILQIMDSAAFINLNELINKDNSGSDLIPPKIEGEFAINTCLLAASNNSQDPIGQTNDIRYLRFADQHNGVCSYNSIQYGDTIQIDTIQIVGYDNRFFAFFDEQRSYQNNINFTIRVLITGNMLTDSTNTNYGIQNINYGFVVTEKDDDPEGELLSVGSIRVFNDADSKADTLTWFIPKN